jgi:hypothetical protein
MSIAGCTIAAKPLWSYARVLARSFRAHHPACPFYVLLADEPQGCVDPDAEPFTCVPLTALALPRLEALRFRYAQQPFTYACTPHLIAWLHAQGVDRVIYFKQESLVTGSLEPLIDRLGRSPIVVTPHLPDPLGGPDAADREQNISQSGLYNVGVLGVAAHPTSARFLRWWADRLFTDCRHDVPNGLHFEQRWLDLLPAFFEGVHVLRDASFNIGHWSLPQRRVSVAADGSALVDGRPLRVFRFSGYRPEEPLRPTRYNDRLSWDEMGDARLLFERVRQALIADGFLTTRTWPYAYATFDNGVAVPELARHLHQALDEDAAPSGDPLCTQGPGSYWQWLQSPAPGTSISRFWHAVWASRPDLQQAYPQLNGEGAARFVAWARQFGMPEHAVPPAWPTEVLG